MLLCLEVSLENPSLWQDSNKVFLYLSSLIPFYVLIFFYSTLNKYLLSA